MSSLVLAFIILGQVCSIFATTPDVATIPQKRIARHADRVDYTYLPGLGSYKVHTEAVNWHTAKLNCDKEGADLAVINSGTEATEVVNLFLASREKQSGSFHSFYAIIGFYERDLEGGYVTVHGDPLENAGYYRWAATEPNNLNGNEHCGSIDGWRGLNDINCGYEYSYICELRNATDASEKKQQR